MHDVAKTEPFEWTEKAQQAFEELKEAMCSDTVLRMPRQGEVFQLYTDASHIAIGAVLCQIDPKDKKSHPCAYGSRKFNDQELKLSTPCKELLAIVYALNLWSFYICGNPVHIFSDCRAWTFLKVQSGVSGKISRLALLVAEYDITVSFVQGVKNKAADGLSRAYDTGLIKYDDQVSNRHPALEYLGAPPIEEGSMKLENYLEECGRYIQQEWPKLLDQYQKDNDTKTNIENVNLKAGNEISYVQKITEATTHLHADKVVIRQMQDSKIKEFEDQLENEDEIEQDSDTTDSKFKLAYYNIRTIAINNSCFTYGSFLALQKDDEFCQMKIELVEKNDIRTINQGYLKKRGLLMRKFTTRDGQVYYTVCIPIALVPALLNATHGNLMNGHLGKEKYCLTLRRKYYWPKMRKDIYQFHDKCVICQYNDKYPVKFTSGYVIRPMYPLHVVHCDLVVGLPRAMDKSYAIFLLYDGFTRHVYGIPLASEKASYVVKKFMSHYVAAYGLMWALHSDNARNLDGAFMRHLTSLLGVVKTSTPPHNAQSNPTETMCGAVAMLIRKGLQDSDKKYWPQALPLILNAINNSVHTATGYTPNELFFGHFGERSMVPLIPFESESANVTEYHQKIRRFQEIAFQIARARNEKRIQTKKKEWDKHARVHRFEIGDYILIKNLNPALGPGETKLRSKYIGPFRIIKVYPSSLVVVPWTENARLEEYYKDPDLFRYVHRGDIRPFHSRQVAVKDCKPYRAAVEEQLVVDPIVLNKFLAHLGLDSNNELLSVKDTYSESETKYDPSSRVRNQSNKEQLDYSTEESESGDSDDPDQDQNLIPVAPMIPVPPAVVVNQQVPNQPVNRPNLIPGPVEQRKRKDSDSQSSESEYHDTDDLNDDPKDGDSDSETEDSSDYQIGPLFDLIEANEEDELLLRDLMEPKKASQGSSLEGSEKNQAIKEKLVDLEKLIISPHDEVRRQAEFDLKQLLDQYRNEQEHPRIELEGEEDAVEEISNSDSEVEEQKEKVRNFILEKSDTEGSERLSKLSEKSEDESDRESMTSAASHITEQSVVPEDSWPCLSERPPPLDRRQRQSVVQIDTPGCRITVSPEDLPPEPPPRPREIRGRGRKDIWDWVSQSPNLPITPQIDRRGRTIKPRTTYSPEREEQRHKELKQRAKQRLLDDNRRARANANLQVQAQEVAPEENRQVGSQAYYEDSTSRSQKGATVTGTRPKTKTETELVKTPTGRQTKLGSRQASVGSRKTVGSKKEGSVRSRSSRKLNL